MAPKQIVVALRALPVLFFVFAGNSSMAQTHNVSFNTRVQAKKITVRADGIVRVGSTSIRHPTETGSMQISTNANAGHIKAGRSSRVQLSAVNISRSNVAGNMNLTLRTRVDDITASQGAEVAIATFELNDNDDRAEIRYGYHRNNSYVPHSSNVGAGYSQQTSQAPESGRPVNAWQSNSKGPSLHASLEKNAILKSAEKKYGITAYEVSHDKALGYQNEYVKVGGVTSTLKVGDVGYNAEKKALSFSPISVESKFAVLEAEYGKGFFDGAVSASAHTEVGTIGVAFNPLDVSFSPEGAWVKGEIGVEAYLAKIDGQGELVITPNTVYDLALRKPLEYASDKVSPLFSYFDNLVDGDPYSDYLNDISMLPSLPEYMDHGIVLRVGGEAGYGIVAQASGGAQFSQEFTGIYASADLGLGGALGLDAGIGFK